MPSKEAYLRLKERGVDLESSDYARYNKNETLASKKDLEFLYEVLFNVKDSKSRPCVFTALSLVANPNFKEIRNHNFRQYFYEPFTDTLKRYYPNEDVFDIWKEGIKTKIFVPQFHGREHLNVIAWLKALRDGDNDTLSAFREGLWGFVSKKKNIEYQAAFQLTSRDDVNLHKKILEDGLKLFESIHGYRAKYFVPPNGPINNELNETLISNGIEFRSTAKIQHESIDYAKTRKVLNWLGKIDRSGIIYLTRNCFFEPSQPGKDWIDNCLNDIRIAFNCKKPAIISSHRVNYIGVLNPSNRDESLRQLKILLHEITKNWPDVEFLSSDQLGSIIKESVLQ